MFFERESYEHSNQVAKKNKIEKTNIIVNDTQPIMQQISEPVNQQVNDPEKRATEACVPQAKVPIKEKHPSIYKQIQDVVKNSTKEAVPRSSRPNRNVPSARLNLSSMIEKLNFIPKNYRQAKECSESKKWLSAMKEEYNSMIENRVWELVELPECKKAISTRWAYTHKLDEEGKIARYKARFVARGFSQIPGEDFDQTFAPVMKIESLRILLCIFAFNNLITRQVDMTTAFLYGNIEEECYIS